MEEHHQPSAAAHPMLAGYQPLSMRAVALIDKNILGDGDDNHSVDASLNGGSVADQSGEKKHHQSHPPSSHHHHHHHHMKKIQVSNLRLAFIQLQSFAVPMNVIDEALRREELHERKSLTLAEFHTVYEW